MNRSFDDLCEHVSRPARYELIELLVNKLGSATKLAAELEVTEMSVRKWLSRATHPSNIHLEMILELAFKADGELANEILRRDFSKFSVALKDVPRWMNKMHRDPPTFEPSAREELHEF